jgi:ATP/maltotriose-dependent transcriptional regulator MalT
MAKDVPVAGNNPEIVNAIEGVYLSRTLIPVLPVNHLSRKSLIDSIKLPVPGSTLITAPAGYGKTSFVTELVKAQKNKVIWYNISENLDRKNFNAHLVQAIRNVVPGFASWFTTSADSYSRDIATKVFNELGLIKEDFILVMDNNRTYDEKDDRLADHIFDVLPKNVHIIGIRRSTPATAYSRFSQDPSFHIYGPKDLRFTVEEVSSILSIHGLDPSDKNVVEVITKANGWPSAVQMIAHNLSRGRNLEDFDVILASDTEPITWLAQEVLSSLNSNEKKILVSLSAVEQFDTEIAEVILGVEFRMNEINALAMDGLYFNLSNNPERTYSFNTIIREALYKELDRDSTLKKTIHAKLSQYFESKREYLQGIIHAQLAGEVERFQELFREYARTLAAKGYGQELIRWAKYIGDQTPQGQRLKQTVELMGLIVDFKFSEAESLIAEMRFGSQGLPIQDFITKFTALAESFIAFAYHRTSDLKELFQEMQKPVASIALGDNDRIAWKRLEASSVFVYDNFAPLEEIYNEAKSIATSHISTYMHLHLESIKAMYLFGQGEYQEAYEVSSSAITLASREGFVGITGPLDVMFVQARCLLEFAERDEAKSAFERVRDLAEKWSQGPWLFLAESYLARNLAFEHYVTEALELLRISRERAASFKVKNSFAEFNDLTEMYIRYLVGDWDRVKILMERVPDFALKGYIRYIYEHRGERPYNLSTIDAMPEKTARENIYKQLAYSELYLDQEKIALGHMRKTLEIGARVRAKEYFLRQDPKLLNLMLKIAGEKPTVYLEDLAASITERLKSSGAAAHGLSAPLTKREIEVLRHLSTGKPISAIAGTLHVSQNTMKTHLKNIYRKIDADGRDSAVERAKALFIL